MTENKDQNLRDYAQKLADAAWNTAKKAGKLAQDAVFDPDISKKILRGLKDGAKAGAKFALETGVSLATNPSKALHTAVGLAEKAVSSIPLIGNALSFGLGTAKDALLDAKLDTLSKNIEGLKDGLENLANSTAKALDGLRDEMEEALGELGAKHDELEQFTKAFKGEQEKVNKQVQKNIENINETLKEHDKKIRDNAEKIFKEQIKLEDVRSELKDQIRTTNTDIDNLRKEQEETQHDFEKYKHQINEKSSKTEQEFEDLQADYTRRNKIIETQINDNEEQLSEFQENLSNVEFQQKKLNLEHQELAEGLEEQVNLAQEQKSRLDFVINEIDEIQEEFNQKIDRITKSQLDQEEKVDEAVFATKRATRKVDELSEKLEKHSKKVDKLQDQIQKNKQDTQKVKEEAKRANERIDNLLKNQQLLDNSKEQQNFDKLIKSLELKAEESQLLASLELLKKTQKLITTPAEREWKVGVKQGTETQIPKPEGYPLKPDSSWAKKYSKEQLQEWGWDTRLLGDNENAPLTDLEKRKPEQAQQSSSQQQQSEQSREQQKNLQEVIEETKSQLLEQLQEIQEQVQENITSLEEKTMAPQEDSESEEEEILSEELEKKETQLRQERAQAKAKLTKSRNKQESLQQQKEQTKSEIIKEQKNIKKLEQSLGNPSTTPQQKQKLQENKIEKEDKLTQLQQQLEKIEVEEKKQEKETQKNEQAVQQKDKEIEKVQQQKPNSITAKKIDKEIKDAEQKVNEAKHEYVEQKWQDIKKLEEQVFEDSPEVPTLKKIEDKIQEIKESQSSTAAPQKSMSLYMLYLIIFLLEYIVYKRNGLPGLVVLNIILLICYWYREQINEHYNKNYKQFGNYLLIIGWIMGNVLAYSAPEQEKYKIPSVVGYNAILASLATYTWYQKRKEVETKQDELTQVQQEFTEETIQKETEYIDRLQETQETLEKIKEKTKNSKTVNFTTLSQGVGKGKLFTSEEDVAQAKKIYEEIKQKYARKESDEHLTSPETKKFLQLVQESGTSLSSEEQELIQKIQQKQKEADYQEFSQLTNKIPTVPEEVKKILTKLLSNLSEEQAIAISAQSPYLKDNQDKLTSIYFHLNKEEKLKLLNSGLDSLQINTKEQKQELLNIRLTIQQEEKSFDLSLTEKENILRLITSQVSANQLKTYEDYGVPLYNASTWQITAEHKKSLLGLTADLIILSEEQKGNLTNQQSLEKFPLSGKQEQILQTLAPLQQECSYSEELLKRSNSLPSRQFLTQKEIIPLSQQKTADPYKELKKKILTKEVKAIRQITKQQQKEEAAQKNRQIRDSLLPSLLFFAQMNTTDLACQEYRLSKETFQEKADWVSMGAIDSQQRDLLFLSGFKSMPKYYFFDLLFFAVENFAHVEEEISEEKEQLKSQQIEEYKTQILVILDGWKDNSSGKEKEAIKKAIKQLSNDSLPAEQQYNRIQLLLSNYPSKNVKLNNLVSNWEKVRQETVIRTSSFANFLEKHPNLKTEWEKYLELVQERQNKELQRKAEWLNSLSGSGKGGSVSVAPNITHLEEKFERLASAYEIMRDYVDSVGIPEKKTMAIEPSTQSTSTSSPYDDLLAGLDKEEQERLKKKKARDEAKKKLDEMNFAKRQSNLSEKDRKLQEEAEKRQREKELEEQEAEKARQSREMRNRAIGEDRRTYLDNEARKIQEAKERAERELAFKEQGIQKEKERRENEIEEARKKNEQEEKRIDDERKLVEQELAKELKKVSLEDKEGRARIEEKFKKRKLEIQKEIDEQKRKNDDYLKELEANAIKEQKENETKLNKMREEIRIQNEQGQKAKEAAKQQERLLKDKKDKELALQKLQNELYNAVLDYTFTSDEAKKGTKNPQKNTCDGLRSFLEESPSMEFNLDFGDIAEVNRTTSRYIKAIEVFRKIVGDKFITKGELKNLIEEKVRDLDY